MTFKDFFNHFLIAEDAVENIEMIGDWDSPKPYGWSKADVGILKSPLGLERIKTKWKITQPVDIYLVKGKTARKHVELGEVSPKYVSGEMGLNIVPDHTHITILYTQNTGAEKIPATPWTLAHRFGHALARKNGGYDMNYYYKRIRIEVEELIRQIALLAYGVDISSNDWNNREILRRQRRITKELCHVLGTFKSARDRNLREDFEFVNEIIAQYIITGGIKLNRDLPRILQIGNEWGRPTGPYKLYPNSASQKKAMDDLIEQYEDALNEFVEVAITNAAGKIYVM